MHSHLGLAMAHHCLLATVTSWMLCRYLIDVSDLPVDHLLGYGAGHKMF